MSWKATAMVKPLTHAQDGTPFSRDAKLVYFVLAEYHHNKTKVSWPSVVQLSAESLMSERHCYRQLSWLEQHGEIRREGVRGGFGRTTAYRLLRPLDEEDEIEHRKQVQPCPLKPMTTAACDQKICLLKTLTER